MLKEEFEKKVGAEISDEEWEVVDTAYLWYNEEFSKEDIVWLWMLDKKIIYDMYPRAKKIRELNDMIAEHEAKIRELEYEMRKLQTQP